MLVLIGVITVMAVYIVVGERFAYGPVLFSTSDKNGMHLSDIPVVGLWLVGVLAAGALWRFPEE